MSRFDELVAQRSKLQADLVAVNGELAKELGVVGGTVATATATAPAPKKNGTGKKRGRKKAQKTEDGKSYPSLKQVVQTILGKHPDGLKLQDIVLEVNKMKDRGEYASEAKSMSAVVSQAVTSLKQEKVLSHDRENRIYKLANAGSAA
jgi:hypothetical protein